MNIRNRSDTPKVSLHRLIAPNLVESLLDKTFNAFVALKVSLNVLFRYLLLDIQLRRQSKGAYSIHNAKVHGLGAISRLLVHRLCVNPEHLTRGQRMDVFASPIRVEQQRVLREVSHQAQLNLRIVGRHQHISRSRHERRPYLPPQSSADWNVLKIRIRAGEAPRRRPNLIEGSVNPALSIGQLRQRVEIRRFELRKLTIFQH